MKSKKAISSMIGYVLLITLAIAMSVLVYNYMQSYVPKQHTECPDGVGIYVDNYTHSDGWLNLTLKNNGRYGISGFYIHGSNDSSQEIAAINLAKKLKANKKEKYNVFETQGGVRIFVRETQGGDEFNTWKPGKSYTFSFNIPEIKGGIKFIEITPRMQMEYENQLYLPTCGDAKIKESISS